MSFADTVLAPWLLMVCAGLALCFIGLALAQRPWRLLITEPSLQHRWLGASLIVVLLWQLRAQAVDWLTLHLMLTSLMTLLFRAPLALLTNLLANLAMVSLGRVGWPLIGVNLIVTGVVPVLVTVGVWRLVDRRLPDNLMVFLFICGFFGSALATLSAGVVAIGLMAVGASDPQVMHQAMEYARFLPLLMPSEAFITGMLLSILMVYHPEWVATFNSHRYIDTK
ncbi:energy-coupling factor ABC transporter permease [Halomonas korlensis]|uniref:Uncharacterized membrane protein n=1 Tax=Halomonas korlensis TaxID=463301 RepID=A0A1I7F4R7_9GAMM|nr:energy-coupling factor ABC transporter permease [Halomonas korlensis]SFU31173.1 Uncharacterized membrane protein [Halomonas korlensis]